jgi:hypothetical protein
MIEHGRAMRPRSADSLRRSQRSMVDSQRGEMKRQLLRRQGPLCLCFAVFKIAASAANAFPKGPFVELLLENKPLHRSWSVSLQILNGRATRPRGADSSQGSAGILPASAPTAISRRREAASPYRGMTEYEGAAPS